MQTIKTAVVVVLLLAVLYGAYVALNTPPTELPAGLEDMEAELNLDPPTSEPFAGGSSIYVPPSDANSMAPPSIPAFPSTAFGNNDSTASPDRMSSVIGLPPATPPAQPPAFPDANKPPLSTGEDSIAPRLPDTKSLVAIPKLNSPSNSQPQIPNGIGGAESTDSSQSAMNSATPNSESTAGNSIQSPPFPQLDGSSNPIPDSDATASTTAPPSTTGDGSTSVLPSAQSFENARKLAMEQINNGKLKEALFTLSMFYSSPALTQEQRTDLLAILDALAGEVIYSRRHLLEDSYKVAGPETLDQIAEKYNVPTEILKKVNGVENPNVLMPGTELKVFKGPFRSEIDITTGEMTLFLDQLYAGRFPISLGNDPAPREGSFTVQSKQKNRPYYGAGGNMVPAGDPKNPLGDIWIDIGNECYIHGSPQVPAQDLSRAGCVSLSPIDAEDVFSMLSKGSRVRIYR